MRPVARYVMHKVRQWSARPEEAQEKTLKSIVTIAAKTVFGQEHDFDAIRNYEDFQQRVPLRSYEDYRHYLELIFQGGKNILWPGQPLYFAKTSGTTSGMKYIPITRDSLGNHFYSAQTALLLFMAQTGKWRIMDGKMIFLSGSPRLEDKNGIPAGRLSGIVNHHIPAYLRTHQLPLWETNCIEDWERKIDAIVSETCHENMTLISGIPPWVQMYFDRLIAKTGLPVKQLFPQLEVVVHGGVNFEPYRRRMEESLGGEVQMLETYPASEGFIAYQDTPEWRGLLLNVDSGIFFEFVPADRIYDPQPPRYSVSQVQTGVQYAVIINSNAGLWGYVLGDTVKFVSLQPPRIMVTGRISQYISAFGEHVIAEEVEAALQETLQVEPAVVTEFTVAPCVNPPDGELPYHEWLIEFEQPPANPKRFAAELDAHLCARNFYYRDLIVGKVLRPLKIRFLRKNTFIDYMKQEGRLGGQNKVPHLSNDRKMADALQFGYLQTTIG